MPAPIVETTIPAVLLHLSNPLYTATLTDAVTLTLADLAQVIKLDPGGAHRNVTLPAAAGWKNSNVLIVNGADAAENLVVKDSDGNTIATINQNEEGLFNCSGSAVTLVRVATITLS